MPTIGKLRRDTALISIWEITETEEQFVRLVHREDVLEAGKFNSPARRRSFLAWRALLRQEAENATITYSPSGAPCLCADPRFISVTHTKSFAALLLSNRPCAIDMEPVDRDFTATRERFISKEEETIDTGIYPKEALLWCAKETLYKFSGRNGLDFKADLRIASIPDKTDRFAGMIRTDNTSWIKVKLAAEIFSDNLFVYTI